MTITALASRVTALEARLDALEHRLAELDALTKMIGDLKFEIEDKQEA